MACRARIFTLLLSGIIYLLLLGLFYIYGTLNWRSLRYSMFYDKDSQEKLLSQRDLDNEAAAAQYIERLIQRSLPPLLPPVPPPPPSPVNLCAVVVTVPRKKRYLYQTLASLLLSNCQDPIKVPAIVPCVAPLSEKLPSLTLHVLYTHEESHPDFEGLSKGDDPRLTVLDRNRVEGRENRTDTNWYLKETTDYATALRWCRDEYLIKKSTKDDRPHITLILEDDIVTTRRALDKLLAGIEPLLKSPDWLLVRLYLTAYWSGWEADDWPMVVLLSLTGGIAGVFLPFFWDNFSGAKMKRGPSTRCAKLTLVFVTALVMMVAGLSTACVVIMLDKQNLPFVTPGKGLHLDGDSAGTPAVLYATQHVAEFLEYILATDRPADLPIDKAVNEFTMKTGLLQYHLVPDLFDHRGVYSSSSEATKGQGAYIDLKISSTFRDEVNLQLFI